MTAGRRLAPCLGSRLPLADGRPTLHRGLSLPTSALVRETPRMRTTLRTLPQARDRCQLPAHKAGHPLALGAVRAQPPGCAPSASRSTELLSGALLRTLGRKIHHFNHLPVNGVVAFSTLTLLSDHHQRLFPEHSHHPRRRPIRIIGQPCLPHSAPDIHSPTSYLRTRLWKRDVTACDLCVHVCH